MKKAVGVLLFFLSLPLAVYGVYMMFVHSTLVWVIGSAVLMSIAAVLVHDPAEKLYCADCGQYLGEEPCVCGRCGCNRYTPDGSGVGRTVRSR